MCAVAFSVMGSFWANAGEDNALVAKMSGSSAFMKRLPRVYGCHNHMNGSPKCLPMKLASPPCAHN